MKQQVFNKSLLTIPDGLYCWKKKKKWMKFFLHYEYYGWLSVETRRNCKEFMWTSGKDAHDASTSPAMNLTIDMNTGRVMFYMESAITMWVKWSTYDNENKYLEKMRMKKYIQEIEYFMLEESNDKTN